MDGPRGPAMTAQVASRAALGTPPTVELLGVRLHALTEAQIVAHILDSLDVGRGGVVVTPNLDHLRRCVHDPEYGKLVATADLACADGMPLIWASRIAGAPLPGLVAGSNLISSLSRGAAQRGRSIFLIGGSPGSAAGAARVLSQCSPGLRVAGTNCPAPGFEHDEVQVARLMDAVGAASPDIIYVGLGSPKQERVIARIGSCLPSAWWLGVGISFSYLTGEVRRAPVIMRHFGLEWLYRLKAEPRRLGRRYVVEGIPFGLRLLSWAVGRRIRSAGEP